MGDRRRGRMDHRQRPRRHSAAPHPGTQTQQAACRRATVHALNARNGARPDSGSGAIACAWRDRRPQSCPLVSFRQTERTRGTTMRITALRDAADRPDAPMPRRPSRATPYVRSGRPCAVIRNAGRRRVEGFYVAAHGYSSARCCHRGMTCRAGSDETHCAGNRRMRSSPERTSPRPSVLEVVSHSAPSGARVTVRRRP